MSSWLKEIFCTIGVAYLAIQLTSSISHAIGSIVRQRRPVRHAAGPLNTDSGAVTAATDR